jgi:ketosteroid isomerase-like protein
MRHIRILVLIVTASMGSVIGSTAFAQQASKQSEPGSENATLEKELFELDQKWLEAARTKNLDFLKQEWTDRFLELMPGFEAVSKPELLDLVAKANRGPGGGAVPHDFKLWAVYGNVAIATDHTSWTGGFVPGHNTAGEYRTVRFFVKEKGKWRIAGAALVPANAP